MFNHPFPSHAEDSQGPKATPLTLHLRAELAHPLQLLEDTLLRGGYKQVAWQTALRGRQGQARGPQRGWQIRAGVQVTYTERPDCRVLAEPPLPHSLP
eukprot:6138100-Amphidinium_carterae.1